MKKLIASLFLVLAIAAPVFAQDATDVIETPVVTETVAPTAEPTVIVAPTEPAPVEPAPIDESKIPSAMWTVILVSVVGIVSVAFVGILTAAKGLPEWAKALLLSGADSGVKSLDDYAKTTDTPVDDLAVVELRKLVEQLRGELRQTQAQVNAVQATITS